LQEEELRLNKIKSKFRRFNNRPFLIWESKIRELDGTILSKVRVASSDKKKLAKAFKDNADLLSLKISISDFDYKKEMEKELEETRELLRKKKEADLKKIREFVNKTKNKIE